MTASAQVIFFCILLQASRKVTPSLFHTNASYFALVHMSWIVLVSVTTVVHVSALEIMAVRVTPMIFVCRVQFGYSLVLMCLIWPHTLCFAWFTWLGCVVSGFLPSCLLPFPPSLLSSFHLPSFRLAWGLAWLHSAQLGLPGLYA